MNVSKSLNIFCEPVGGQVKILKTLKGG